MKNEFDRKDKFDIILGETPEGQKVTLNDCDRRASHGHFHAPSEYSITANNILLGEHFNRPEDIVFSSIYVTYRGDKINSWISNIYLEAPFELRNSVEARIEDEYIISVTAKKRSSSRSEGTVQKTDKCLEHCIEIKSLKEKRLEEYRKVNSSVLDFLNFIIPQEVDIESIHGVLLQDTQEDSKQNNFPFQHENEVKIFYGYTKKKKVKPHHRDHQIFPYDESQRASLPEHFQEYLLKWF